MLKLNRCCTLSFMNDQLPFTLHLGRKYCLRGCQCLVLDTSMQQCTHRCLWCCCFHPCRSVSCGLEHTVCITPKDVIAWGSNEYGQLGHGDQAPDIFSRPCPIKVLHDVMVTQVCTQQRQQLHLQSKSRTTGQTAQQLLKPLAPD